MSYFSLSRPISDNREIQDHIYSFYYELLGKTIARCCDLALNPWGGVACVYAKENLDLGLTFFEQQLESIVSETKCDTTPPWSEQFPS